jgi:thymidylate synthase (FAD)
MTEQQEILEDVNYVPIYEHGFVGLVDWFGDDSTPPRRARMSYGKGTKSVSDDRNLLRYLIRHKHNTPVEMVELVFHIKLPIFVMRQHVRHRTASINEYSARYSEMSNEFYVPFLEDIALQSTTNKQGRIENAIHPEEAFEFEEKTKVQEIMGQAYAKSYEAYQQLLDMGLTRELARSVLPVANYTECFWKVNLHNFFNYSRLRRDSHAQKEIRAFADPMFQLVEARFPMACEAFNDYIFEAVTFSRMEKNLLRHFINRDYVENALRAPKDDKQAIADDFGMTMREMDEFEAKLKDFIGDHAEGL